jgi:hypothetical protein
MAQASKSSTKSTGSRKRSSSRGSNGGGPSSSSRSKTSTRSRNGASASSRAKRTTTKASSQAAAGPATAAKEAAAAGTKAAGKAVSTAVSKAKTPLLVGGAAIAGVVGGAALKDRMPGNRSNGLAKRFKGMSMPNPTKNVDLGKLTNIDFDKVASTAQKVGNYGRQVDEVASAVKRASESAKKGK